MGCFTKAFATEVVLMFLHELMTLEWHIERSKSDEKAGFRVILMANVYFRAELVMKKRMSKLMC